jgi:hypothetical protein
MSSPQFAQAMLATFLGRPCVIETQARLAQRSWMKLAVDFPVGDD